MLARRLLLLMAALMALMAMAVAIAPPPQTAPVRPVQPEPDAASTGGAPAAEPAVVERTLDAVDPGATVSVAVGQTVRLTVRANVLGSVELVGLDRVAAVTPDVPATFDLLADRPGIFAVVLSEADLEIGRLRVTGSR